ncbi:MAG: DUF4924 family protein [Bacteroidota bacterium]
MTIGELKYRENIAEYILYLWQMQDLLRAVEFNVEALDGFIRSYIGGEDRIQEEKMWLQKLSEAMSSDGVLKKGSVVEISELISELNFLHQTLTTLFKDNGYLELFENIQEPLAEYKLRSGAKNLSDVEMCLTALYGLLLLRLKKQQVSEETAAAMESFTKWLAFLSVQYHKMKKGEELQYFN